MYVVYNWKQKQFEDRFSLMFQSFSGTADREDAVVYKNKIEAEVRAYQMSRDSSEFNEFVVMKLAAPTGAKSDGFVD